MLKLLETLWSSFWLCGFAIVLGVGGYFVCRRAEAWGRQAAEATAHLPPMLRWLCGREYSSAEFIWRYRLVGIGALVVAGICFVYAAVAIIAAMSAH
jgi:hypothetical protein